MIGSSKGKLLVFAVFLLGIGTGAVATYEYANSRSRSPRRIGTTIGISENVGHARTLTGFTSILA